MDYPLKGRPRPEEISSFVDYPKTLEALVKDHAMFEAVDLVRKIIKEADQSLLNDVLEFIQERGELVSPQCSGEHDYIWIAIGTVAAQALTNRKRQEALNALERKRPEAPQVRKKGRRVSDLKFAKRMAARDD